MLTNNADNMKPYIKELLMHCFRQIFSNLKEEKVTRKLIYFLGLENSDA
jgi:hypothetical protein